MQLRCPLLQEVTLAVPGGSSLPSHWNTPLGDCFCPMCVSLEAQPSIALSGWARGQPPSLQGWREAAQRETIPFSSRGPAHPPRPLLPQDASPHCTVLVGGILIA